MAKVRITCKRPEPAGEVEQDKGLRVNGPLSSLADVRVILQLDDGTEEELKNVVGITWIADMGEPTHAHIEVDDVEVDIETDADIA